MYPSSLFSLSEHLERLSKDGDPLEILAGTVEFERFRPLLNKCLGYSDGAKGGRPPFDPVAMFKVLVVQAQHNLSDAGMEFMIRDRLSWMRFFGFDLGRTMPDENTIRHYRNRLSESGALEALMQAFEQQLRAAGYLRVPQPLLRETR
jgi:transposase, IS5 family